ncbi:MAG TPA: VanW family protein [Negativicutes bacterium]|nr:VanW family protein [Negativicutes bacterium]
MRLRLLIWSLLAVSLLCGGIVLWQARQFSKPLPAKVQTDVTLEGLAVGSLTAGEVRETVRALAATRNQGPVNAGFRQDAPGFMPEKDGQTINVEATVRAVLQAPPKAAVSAIMDINKPPVTVEKLRRAPLIGQAATPLLDKGENRVHNIRLAAQQITNTVVAPGEIFSFNGIIGATTAERGYREAPVLENGRKSLGMGGGVCQISSTLYNAVMAGNLTVTERHPHSKPVDYIAAGKDATTSDDKDFKFRNNRQGPLIIHVLVTGAAVKAEIWEIAG